MIGYHKMGIYDNQSSLEWIWSHLGDTHLGIYVKMSSGRFN